MAIRNRVLLDIGVEIENSYIRIDTISGYKDKIDMTLKFYVSRNAFKEGSSFIKQKNYIFVPTIEVGATNFITQGYEYLKTLDEFIFATNVPFDGSPD